VRIDVATEADRLDVLSVERAAFGGEEEASLTADLLDDPSAVPVLSLLARDEGRPVGHILFSAVSVTGHRDVRMAILCPLAVVPDAQRTGVGSALVAHGLQTLSASGTGLVFVLGHPAYYPRHGFRPAGALGLDAPFPIPAKDAGAWMVTELMPGLLGVVRGTVTCADALSRPELWRE